MKIKIGDIVVIAVFAVVIVLSLLFIKNYNTLQGNNLYAKIRVINDEYVYPLSQNRTLVFEGANGKSVIQIKDNQVFFEDSTCNDYTCVKMGKAGADGAKYLACLPNQVIVSIIDKADTEEIY